jgi:thioredoxin reductase (NADPH)
MTAFATHRMATKGGPTMTDMAGMDANAARTRADGEAFLNQLRTTFAKMPHEIPLLLFTEKGRDDVFAQANRQVIRAFRELTDKISLREYDLGHEMARKYGVSVAPTLVIAPDRYNIHWIGAPMGEEARTFLELLLLVGSGHSNASDQSLKVVEKIDSPRHIKVFISPSCPYCPQQAVNGAKAVVASPDLISLELIDIQCRPDIAEQYGAHSVPVAYANETLIGQGAQQEEVFMSSLHKLEAQTIFIPDVEADVVETDVTIVGGGPAGLTAAIYAVRSGLKTALVEADALGGQVATTPIVENYPGFTQVGGKTLVDIMVNHALEYVQIFQGEKVIAITPGTPHEVQTTRRKFITKTVLLATGASHRKLGVPGEARLSGRGVSYCATCDGPLFRNKKVIIVGGGNSAVTEALHLFHMGVDVKIVHRRDKLRAQEYLAKSLKDTGIPVLWNTEVVDILGEERVTEVELINNQTQEKTTMPVDGVFLSIGYTPAVELARKTGVALTEDGYIARDAKHRTNIPGIYAAGDVEGGYKQIITATGMGAEAAMTIFEDIINPYWQKEA